jgi:hypothetical protein
MESKMERSSWLSVRKFQFRNCWTNFDKFGIGGYSKYCGFDLIRGVRPRLNWDMGSSVKEKLASSTFRAEEYALP